MLQFYGFSPSFTKIVPTSDYEDMRRNWVKLFNHNHLRITRILRSLRVLGLEAEAKNFFEALVGVFHGRERGKIGERSMVFWTRAVERPLFIAPEVEDEDEDVDTTKGLEFLRVFERERISN